ncbi:MAG: hypothetical protein A2167_08285 [Planctomycetes bacterium RBG_13_46_10]|nr:MAG: hypothetical protein A2167_08285 [Planctomycetes bacterium RBG_13_46_10]
MANGAAGAAVVAAIANAIKAMGSIVVVEPQEFLNILRKTEKPLVVYSPAGLVTKYKYITSYKGLVFFTKSKEALLIPASAETITARKIEVPF